MSTPATDVPDWAPAYDATLRVAWRRFWTKYSRFDGRASRAEYWWTWLFLAVPYVVFLTLFYTGLGIWSATSDDEGPPPVLFPAGGVLVALWFLATVLPWLALEARRLHDANMSGLLLLIHIASWPGALAVFILTQLSPNPLGRRFDAPPGEQPRYARVGVYPPAPGEPDVPLVAVAVGAYPPPSPQISAPSGSTPGAPEQERPST